LFAFLYESPENELSVFLKFFIDIILVLTFAKRNLKTTYEKVLRDSRLGKQIVTLQIV